MVETDDFLAATIMKHNFNIDFKLTPSGFGDLERRGFESSYWVLVCIMQFEYDLFNELG